MAPKKGGGGSSSGGGSSGSDDDYEYDGSGSGSGSGDNDDYYGTGSGSGTGGDDDDDDYYGTGKGTSSGSGDDDYDNKYSDNDYKYDDDDDYNYGYDSGSKNSNNTTAHGLASYNWKDPAVNALFAMNIITILVLVLCMVLTRRFKWIREKGTDKLRNSGYFVAAFCMFLHFVIVATRTAVIESGAVVTSSFLIAFIFERLFSLIGDVLIVAIIARTILEDMGSGSGKLAGYTSWLMGVVSMVAVVAFSFYAALYGQYMAMSGVNKITADGARYMGVFYSAYIFGISMYLSVLSCIAVVKRRSTGPFLMLFLVMPSLFLRFLVNLINESILSFQTRTSAAAHIGLADSFMYTFTTISIFLVVALIGGLRQRHSEGGMTQEQKLGLQGHQYVALGPYAAPPAPYGAQAPVGHYPSDQNAAPGKPIPHPQQVPVSYAAQGQYPPPGQYAPPVQPVQYAPPGQFVQQGMTSLPTAARSVSPVHAPVAVSAASGYIGTTSSVSPTPPQDPYQLHMPPHH